MKLSIIIPVYNEHRTILELIERLKHSGCADFEWIFVDDGSNDGTTELLKSNVPSHQIVILREVNRGKTSAVRTGLEAATGDWVIIQDADLEYDPSQIPLLLVKAEQSPVHPVAVYGQRPSCWKDPTRWIFALGVLAVDIALYLVHGGWVRDHATCYKLLPTSTLRAMQLNSIGFEGCIEITAKLMQNRIPIIRIPVTYRPRSRRDGKKLSWTYGLKALTSVWNYRN
jgi:dolichol-phosphate mannosyltransferase